MNNNQPKFKNPNKMKFSSIELKNNTKITKKIG